MDLRKVLPLVVGVYALSSSVVYAVGPTADMITPSDSQREATFAAAGVQPTPVLASPAVAFGSPLGFGLNYGQIAVGIGGQTLPRGNTNHVDGSMGVAAGFGDSAKTVGLELTANIISLRDNFAEDGSFNIKVHRLLNATTSLAIGAESLAGWGAARDSRISSYAALSSVFNPGVPLVVNVGVGTNRFRDTGETSRVGAFGSVAIVPTDRFSLIADFTGVDTNLGVSLVPLKALPVTLTLGLVNLQEHDGLTREFAGGVGYLYRY